LHGQQPEKDNQNSNVAPPGNISADNHVLKHFIFGMITFFDQTPDTKIFLQTQRT